jgi:RNA polymerase sigma-70 factor (ECF subfamily)
MKNETGQDETELIRRFQHGDEEAFHSLLAPCEAVLRARIERRIANILRRRLSVSDVLQETRLTAFQRRRELEDRGPGSFRKWLFGIVDNEMSRGIKRHAGTAKRTVEREVSKNLRIDTSMYPGKETSPSQAAIGSEMANLAKQAMAELPEDYATVLRLVRTEHLNLREAAERMDRSHAAARQLYVRALLAFTRAFQKLGGGVDD